MLRKDGIYTEEELLVMLTQAGDLYGQLENVLAALETGGDVAITGEDGRRTIELITAIYKAGSSRQTVTLPIGPGDPFYTVDGIRAAVPHFYEKTTSVESQDGDLSFGNVRKGEK